MKSYTYVLLLFIVVLACKEPETTLEQDCESYSVLCAEEINFLGGFTAWPYAPELEAVNDTYEFIQSQGTIYSEHIDANIPWQEWINGSELPIAFVNDIESRAQRRTANKKLTVSVSVLNSVRTDLALAHDGSILTYDSLNEERIIEAYVSHLSYITQKLQPDYLLVAIESNELLIQAPEKWPAFKKLMLAVRVRMKAKYPSLPIFESITLHNFYEPEVEDPSAYIQEIAAYANEMDKVGISFYPFFKGLNDADGFQSAFDFLHQQINKPIVISETGHLSEDLSISAFNLFIPGSEEEQASYLQSLLQNAYTNNYEYIIWWTHRDYDRLWETFPAEVKDLGKIWISTGLLNEDGRQKAAFQIWDTVIEK